MDDKTATHTNLPPESGDEFPTLPRAPITEALVDIRATLPPGSTLDSLREIPARLSARFTDVKTRKSWRANIALTEGTPRVEAASDAAGDGLLLISPGENLALQVRLDGFTVSKLKPYDRWATLRPEVQALWKIYAEVAKPTRLSRLAIRTINRIELPGPSIELKEYILTAPDIAPDVPQTLNTFFMRLVVPDAGGTAIITELMEPQPTSASTLPLIFDIDAFKEVDFSSNDERIWKVLDELRGLKNRIFFRSLTKRCLESFQ